MTSERVNAAIGWAMAAVMVVGSVESLLTNASLWGSFVLFVVAVTSLPAVTFRDWSAMVPWPLVTATATAGVGYASFRALELHSEAIDVPPEFRAVFIVVFVLAAGVFWEVLEFALGGGLVTVYGIDDIVTDFVFNAVGAAIVAVWGGWVIVDGCALVSGSA